MKPEAPTYFSTEGIMAELARIFALPNVGRPSALGSRLVCDFTVHHFIRADGSVKRKVSKCPGRACLARKIVTRTVHNRSESGVNEKGGRS